MRLSKLKRNDLERINGNFFNGFILLVSLIHNFAQLRSVSGSLQFRRGRTPFCVCDLYLFMVYALDTFFESYFQFGVASTEE